MVKTEQDAKQACYLAICAEFPRHLDEASSEELLMRILEIICSNLPPEVKYFDIRHAVLLEQEKVAQYNIDNKDDWQAYLDDQGLSRY